jgi:hypothetical protein
MKKLTILFITLISISISLSAQQGPGSKTDPAGTWRFTAPYAPEGYQSGTINIAMAEQKYTASMAFTGVEYNFTGSNVKLEKDVLTFSISVESESVFVTLKQEEPIKMTGTAVYSGGSVPLTLTKEVKSTGK